MEEENSNIELRSEEVEDILGKVPAWVTRNGILMLFFILILLLAGAWIFKVPDVKNAHIFLTSLQPAADIESRANGKIEHLFITDNQTVQAGMPLAVIENPADYQDVMSLKNKLTDLPSQITDLHNRDFTESSGPKLGMIQPEYAAFFKNFRDYKEFIHLDYHQRKIELLQQEKVQYASYSENLDTRASILKAEYDLVEKQYLRDSSLLLQGVISDSDFELSKSKMLSSRAGWQAMLSLKAENDIKISGIREQVLEMELKKQEQLMSITTSLEESLNKLLAVIETWEKKYLLVAPIDGQVTFNKIWSANQNVKEGDKVMTIIPKEEGQLLGKIQLPVSGAGKVKEGQPVNIRFDNYPYLEYGMVKGSVSNVSKVPQDNYYTVEVTLPEGLITYYGIEIGFSQNMQGSAEILTDKMRLLQRFFNPVRSAISRQKEM